MKRIIREMFLHLYKYNHFISQPQTILKADNLFSPCVHGSNRAARGVHGRGNEVSAVPVNYNHPIRESRAYLPTVSFFSVRCVKFLRCWCL